jgi:anhydro-N-acetylmuramic acid kinase
MQILEAVRAKQRRRIVGLISGTSADGVDAVLVEVAGSGTHVQVEALAFQTVALPDEVRQGIFTLFGNDASVDELCRLNFALGEVFAQAALAVIAAAGLRPEQVDLIGSHGQTVRHLPDGDWPSTLQIGEPAVIAQRTGITTIADFRPADMAVGGQGAPLVPLVDHLLFTHAERGRLVLNIGGIANVTVLPAAAAPSQITAFDLGPGNALVDAAVSHFSGGTERFDDAGAQAARGQVDESLLQHLLKHEYLARTPPKSTGREIFGAAYCADLWRHSDLPAADFIATLTSFTAESIIGGLRQFVLPAAAVEELWIGGGGLHNCHLLGLLKKGLPELRVGSLAALGVDPDAREALTFAVLANETLMGQAGNLPKATGAERPVVLGKIVPGQNVLDGPGAFA